MITTIIPTYNRANLLPKAINSIQKQTYSDFILCIYDNKSTDDTEEVVREFMLKDSRIKYVKHQTNIGLMQNFIHGISAVKTPFFNLLSDDDSVDEKFFERAIKKFKDHPEIAFYAGATLHCDHHGRVFGNPVGNWEREGVYGPIEGFREMIYKGHPDWTGILFRSSILKDVYPDIRTDYAADYDFELRIASRFPIYICKDVVARFNLHTGSESFRAKLSGMWPAWYYLIENIKNNQTLDYSVKRKVAELLKKRLIGKIFRAGIKSLITKEYKQCEDAARILSREYNCYLKSQLLICSSYLVRKIGALNFLLKNFVLIGAWYRRKTGQYKF